MTVERGLRLLAGIVVSASLVLSQLHSVHWLWLTAFAGINLLQSGLTNWCPAVWALRKAGLRPCEGVPTSSAQG